jgi:hypothetical protein
MLHNAVPHHHHCNESASYHQESATSEDWLELLSSIFHEDLGQNHLEDVCLDVDWPQGEVSTSDFDSPVRPLSRSIFTNGQTQNLSWSYRDPADLRGPPVLNA